MNDRIADVAEKYLRKGSKVYIEGKLQTRKWTDQSGQEKYTTEVLIGRFGGELQLLDRNPNAGSGGDDYAPSRIRQRAPPQAPRPPRHPPGPSAAGTRARAKRHGRRNSVLTSGHGGVFQPRHHSSCPFPVHLNSNASP